MRGVQTVRVARPTDRLDEVVRFYRDGLGLTELGRFQGHAGYDGVILELGPGQQLEFTSHADGSPGPAPTRDNLLVFYVADPPEAAEGLESMGHVAVEAENPYWTGRGAITFEDPDGWRVVLAPLG